MVRHARLPVAPPSRLRRRVVQTAASLILALPALAFSEGVDEPQPDERASPTHRIVTLAPHATEMVFAAGGGDQIVGTVLSSDYPEAARALPRLGDGITLNPERLVVLQPTLIIGWQRSGAAAHAEILAEALNARMLYSAPSQLRDIPDDIRRIGRLLGTDRTAADAAARLDARIDALEQGYADLAPISVFIEVSSLPLYTIGGDPLLNDVLRLCGAVNIYGASALPAPRVPVESVLTHNPQLLITSERSRASNDDALRRWSGYGLPAALQGHVHQADPDALYRPGPRLIDAAEALCSAVHEVRLKENQAAALPHTETKK